MVGYKKDLFNILGNEVVDYDDTVYLYNDDSMLMHNKAIICLLNHVQ